MPKFHKIHKVAHFADDMFALVSDVEKYPEFVPLCRSLNIRSRRQKGDNTIIVADMCVAYKLISETFTSQVVLKQPQLRIDVQYIDGPFKYLRNIWEFTALEGQNCKISFSIDYEFKSKTLGILMGGMFEYAFARFTGEFEKRADKIYSKFEKTT